MDEKKKVSSGKKDFVPAKIEKVVIGQSVIVTSGNGFETGEETITPTEQTWDW